MNCHSELDESFRALNIQDKSSPSSLASTNQEALVSSTVEDNVTALMSASQDGQTETVSSLLAKGVGVDSAMSDKTTALMLASQEGHTDTVSVLLCHKAQVDLQDNEGKTSLLLACHGGHLETVKSLLEHGADVNVRCKKGVTPLILASQSGFASIVALLLDSDAHIDVEDADGRFPLLVASNNGHKDTLELLLKRGANVNKQNRLGYSALMGACLGEQVHCVELLMQHCADVTLKRPNGTTALDFAHGKEPIERVLTAQLKAKQLQSLYKEKRSLSEPQEPSKSIATQWMMSHDYSTNKPYDYCHSISQCGNGRLRSSSDVLTSSAVPIVITSNSQCCTISHKGNTKKILFPSTPERDIHVHVHLSYAQSDTEASTRVGHTTMNPMPEGSLSLHDLGTLEKVLWDVRPKWDRLGLQLQLDPATIEVIEREKYHEIDLCFTEMLTRWLKGEGQSVPTLDDLIEALRSPPVDHVYLIEELRKNFSLPS